MSEVIYIRCDGVGCMNQVPKELLEESGWIKDDLDADFCGNCQEVAKDLEASVADANSMEAFGKLVSAEADKIEAKAEELGLTKPEPETLGVPVIGPAIPQEQFDEAQEEVIRDLKKDLKKQKKSKEFIEETERLLRQQAADLRKKG